MTTDDDWEEREARTRAFIRDNAKRIIALRSKDREFHGLEREFRYFQEQMLIDFERSADLKHPRDLGSVREVILRKFLSESGYIPEKFGVSDRSVRVVSPTGHISNEIDIALYDRASALTLMKREDVYAAYPIESVFGVIQVKSRLTKSELASGLKNLVSFKSLERSNQQSPFGMFYGRAPSPKGFAILFAFTTDMQWREIITQLDEFARTNAKHNLPNAVIILDRGEFLFAETAGGGFQGHYVNEKIEAIKELKVYSMPDREGLSLYQLYWILLDLLRNTWTSTADPSLYFRLPLVANELSYTFQLGQFAEMGHCDKHGDFARKIPTDKLRIVVDWCSTAQSFNWIEAVDLAYGNPRNEEAYKRQPGQIRVYNPENMPFSDILVHDAKLGDKTVKGLAFDTINSGGMDIFIPYYYTIKEGLITGCTACSRPPKVASRAPAKKRRQNKAPER